MMTLLALSLAIGLLIDDAIVVQENIMRHVEEGMPARKAASFATDEIALAVIATSLAIAAVFVPVAFMKGIVGRFFFQFALTVVFAVMISTFISFTLDPMLSSRLLRKKEPGFLYKFSESFFVFIEKIYEKTLAVSLRWRWIVVAIAITIFFATGYVTKLLRSEFLPLEDQSEFNIKVKAPLGSSISYTDEVFKRISQKIEDSLGLIIPLLLLVQMNCNE
jgi:HAE1 family hydrophobic/amphiphilic exporter-1